MHKGFTAYLYLFSPTISGTLVYILIAAITFSASYFSNIHSFFNSFRNSIQDTTTRHSISHTCSIIVGSTFANTAALWLFWLIVGIVTYSIGSYLAKNLTQLEQALRDRNYVWPKSANSNRPLIDFIFQSFISLFMLMALIVYCKWMIKFILTANGNAKTMIAHAILFVEQIVLLHVIIILIRLFFWRSRLFSIQ